MARRDIVVAGASAGGIEALGDMVRGLPGDLNAAVFVVLHLAAEHKSVLPRILSAEGRLPAKHAVDGEEVHPGHIYVARPDHHMTLSGDRIRVLRGPRENGHRPAVDALFRTAAHSYGPRVIGVILSGALDDGTAGLLAVKQQGGLCIVQDPDEALVEQMPRSAMDQVEVDHVLSAAEIGKLLPSLVKQQVSDVRPDPPPLLVAETLLMLNAGTLGGGGQVGKPSAITCPACGGVLNEVKDGNMVRYRCPLGHAYAPESLYGEQRIALESALWAALRALEDQGALARRLAGRARELRQLKSADRYEERGAASEQQARLVRQILGVGLPPKD
jgi:two-component system, chemotaxis family, protein-glutamate methylesterase/glutaminase